MAIRPLSVKDLEKTRAIVATEPRYVHTYFNTKIGNRNCFCVLGALASVRGFTGRQSGGIMYLGLKAKGILRHGLQGRCEDDIQTCGNPFQSVTRGQAVDIIDRFIAALKEIQHATK